MYAMEPTRFFVTIDPVTFSFAVDSDNSLSLLVEAPGTTFRGQRIAATGSASAAVAATLAE
jgi:hypothetical protein